MRRSPVIILLAWSLQACAAGTTSPVAPAPVAPGAPLSGAPARPVPYPVDYPAGFVDAIRDSTRTATGEPGRRYWQQSASYKMTARIDPVRKRLDGTADIRYRNNSPHGLNVVFVNLAQNLHAPGVPRNEQVEVTGGIELRRVSAFGQRLSEVELRPEGGAGYAVEGTVMAIRLPRPIGPGESAALSFEWAFEIPQAGAGERMGWSGDDLFFLAYWYPHLAVFDDVVGWSTDPFVATTEFYADFARYDVTIEVPAGWLVRSTGRHLNPEQVLAPQVLERLRLAETSDTVVHVVSPADFGKVTRAATTPLRWQFEADSVRDVAFSITRESRWDVLRTPVGDRNGDGSVDYARIESIWRPAATRWQHAARYAAHSIRFLSDYTGLSYAYPHMTAVEGAGIIGGGMEFPMMTLIGDYTARGDTALYNVVAHELAHMWLPMMLSTDERRYSWLDEGTTSFNETQAAKDFFPGYDSESGERASYLQVVEAGVEGEIMRRSAFHYEPFAYGIASYAKPAMLLMTLRGLLGEETFNRAHREFYDRWAFKHPYPWDFWNTFENVSGRDLDWFWRSWYYETWTLDQAVRSVDVFGDSTRIIVEDRGRVPMPVRLTVTRQDGSSAEHEIPVDVWLRGANTAEIMVPGRATRVEIDARNEFPDVDRENNVWRR